MTIGTTDRARLQTLTDAITEAIKAIQLIRPDEQVESVTFDQFDSGGWFWSIGLLSRRELGNTKTALAPTLLDCTTTNTRKVVEEAIKAQQKETAR